MGCFVLSRGVNVKKERETLSVAYIWPLAGNSWSRSWCHANYVAVDTTRQRTMPPTHQPKYERSKYRLPYASVVVVAAAVAIECGWIESLNTVESDWPASSPAGIKWWGKKTFIDGGRTRTHTVARDCLSIEKKWKKKRRNNRKVSGGYQPINAHAQSHSKISAPSYENSCSDTFVAFIHRLVRHEFVI